MERAGIPAALICTLTSIAASVGANRIVSALGIPHPVGDPSLSPEDEKRKRRSLAEKALKTLTAPITEQTIF